MGRLLGGLLGGIAIVAILGANVALWAQRTALSTPTFVDALDDLPADPEVQASVARFVADTVETQVLAMPELRTPLVLSLVTVALQAGRPAIEATTKQAMGTPAFAKVWREGLTALHTQAVASIRNPNTANPTKANTLIVDLDPISAVVVESVGSLLPLEFGDQLELDLPPYELDTGDGLTRARTYVKNADQTVIALIALTVVSFFGCLALVWRRWTALLVIGICVACGAAATYVAAGLGWEALDTTGMRPAEIRAARSIYDVVSEGLRSRSVVLGCLALAIAVVGAVGRAVTESGSGRQNH